MGTLHIGRYTQYVILYEHFNLSIFMKDYLFHVCLMHGKMLNQLETFSVKISFTLLTKADI